MSRFLPEPPHAHGTGARVGVLLIQLGTPEAPTPSAVRDYLRQFLSDPRVVEIPRAIWLPILHLWVLATRPRASARRYAGVWMSEGAPLRVHTERQTRLLRGSIGERAGTPPLTLDYAMRYGKPSIRERLAHLKAQGCDRILLVPLYPQYSASTTATALDEALRWMEQTRAQPALRTVRDFHDHPGYVGALAQSVRDYWMKTGRPDVLVVSFHGVSRVMLERGDPYPCECQKTARLLAEALNLPAERCRVAFQSRLGRGEWLKPYTADVLDELGRQKAGRVDVVCPGFVSDCLETLEEIAIEGKSAYLSAGGREFHAIPCLNERDDWIRALTDIVLAQLVGWADPATPEALEQSRLRALSMGARS
jgi:ferrochelatase